MAESSYDVLVVGGGAAGLSAALVLGRARRSVVVVDAGAPRNAPAAHMHGYLSRDGMAPSALLAQGRHEVAGYGVDLVDDVVLSLQRGFTADLASGLTVSARRVLIASGVADKLPDLPGVQERWGRDLLHCPYCHGWEVRDEPLGVLGTLPGSVEHAHLVRQWSDDVVFFEHIHAPGSTRTRRSGGSRDRSRSWPSACPDSRGRPSDGRRDAGRESSYRARRYSCVREALPHGDGLLGRPGLCPRRGWLPHR